VGIDFKSAEIITAIRDAIWGLPANIFYQWRMSFGTLDRCNIPKDVRHCYHHESIPKDSFLQPYVHPSALFEATIPTLADFHSSQWYCFEERCGDV
jgi:hypothetical protein